MAQLNSPTSPSNPMSPTASPLQPTFQGFVGDTMDALILFEATIVGYLHRVSRRPHDRERPNLIRSGSIFIYEEGASGIKRWTDGVPWSPSRILGNFLIYRELERPFPPGEKKRAKPKSKSESGDTPIKSEVSDSTLVSPSTPQASHSPVNPDSGTEHDTRSLVGSLTDSYAFKEGGLVKKTMSVTVNGVHFHMVSYYTPDDVTNGHLQRPGQTTLKTDINVRNDLLQRQNFRAPIDGADEPLPTSPFAAQSRQQYMAANSAYMGGSTPYIQTPTSHAGFPQSPHYVQTPTAQDAFSAHRQSFSMHSPQHAQPPQHPHPHAQQSPYGDMAHMQQMQMRQQQQQQQQQQQSYAQYPHYSDPRNFQAHDQYPQPHNMQGWPHQR